MLELMYGDTVLQFEHSLVALSKWESKYKKPFLGKVPPTPEEFMDYFSMMLLTPDVNPDVVYGLEPAQLESISDYINDPHTASVVPNSDERGPHETVTSELIYYWMVAMKINWEAQYWHLGRLMTLIKITNFKMQPEKKQNKAATQSRWAEINEKQKRLFKTKG